MKDFFHRHVLHNFGIKLLSLALAVGLWLAVASDPPAEVAVDVPIVFRNIPENLEISSENVPRAQIRVRGPQRVVRRLQPADIYAEIELSGMKPGERTFDLTAQQVHQPRELEVVQVIPNQFHLIFDTRLTRQVPVRPRAFGNFAAGYQIGRLEAEPRHRLRSADHASVSRPSRPPSPTRSTPAEPWTGPLSCAMLTSLIPWCR